MKVSWYDCMKIYLWHIYDHGARNEFKFVNKELGITKRRSNKLQERYTMITDEEIRGIEKEIMARGGTL